MQKGLFVSLGAEKSKIKDLIDNVNQITEERFRNKTSLGECMNTFFRLMLFLVQKKMVYSTLQFVPLNLLLN